MITLIYERCPDSVKKWLDERRRRKTSEDGRMTIVDEASDVTPEMFERVQDRLKQE